MLILASASPRRADILRAAGITFRQQASSVTEAWVAGEAPDEYVRRLARDKTDAVAGPSVLGADTIVVSDGEILEKPRDADEAVRMLGLLQGRTHQVITGICVRHGGRRIVDHEITSVRFLPLDAGEIRRYVSSGEPMDKAGGYAIQGLASKYIDRVEGCYFNVVGLPISLVWRKLIEIGYQSTTEPSSS